MASETSTVFKKNNNKHDVDKGIILVLSVILEGVHTPLL